METTSDGYLRRTASQTSSRSTKSRQSGTVRVKPRRYASNASLSAATTPSDKSLTSFPSLSPEEPAPLHHPEHRNGLLKRVWSGTASPAANLKACKSSPSIVDTLTATSPALRSRTALFDDTPLDSREVPGTLHHASDEHIERLMARTGAIALVRQLAGDLAQRDAQMSALRRRTEERERVLRRMLRECEVSHLDIESRLRELEEPRQRLSDASALDAASSAHKRKSTAETVASIEGSIDEMVNQAMNEQVGHAEDHDDALYDGLGIINGRPDATLRPKDILRHEERRQRGAASPGLDAGKQGNTKGWKNYFLGGSSSRRASQGSIAGNDDALFIKPRAVSSGQRRPGLKEDLFQPPNAPPLPKDRTSLLHQTLDPDPKDNSDWDARSQKSSTSITSWALRLVAGNSQGSREPDRPSSARGRAATVADSASQGARSASQTSTNTTNSMLNRQKSRAQLRRPTAMTTIGPGGTLKRTYTEIRASGSAPPPVTTEDEISTPGGHSGPVEMDTILPLESRPPTLNQTYNHYHPTDYLTDRFGFIYDQRRKKRQDGAAEELRQRKRSSAVETLSNMRDIQDVLSDGEEDEEEREEEANGHVNRVHNRDRAASVRAGGSRPGSPGSTEEQTEIKTPKRWQDYLKLATFPTELLSHTPSAGPITSLLTAENEPAPTANKSASSITVDKGGSMPSASVNPEPSASSIVSGHATITRSSGSGAASPVPDAIDSIEPVKLLLDQLTDLHDSLQRDKTVRWNEFLRKVRAERKREGIAAATNEGSRSKQSMPEAFLTDGEIVGVAGLGNKGKVGRAKWKEFKMLLLGGIPVAYRAKIWAECSGASAMRVPGQYEELVHYTGNDDPVIVAQIQMDIHRTLTDNIFFRKGPGVGKLNQVLLAYSRRNPEVGYCQGMNLIAACLLLIMPTAEDAFWMLTTMIENILPQGYYDHSLLTSRADQQVLRQYVAEVLPTLSAHLEDLGIELEALTFQWFLSVFTDCLSAEALFRLWDIVLCTNDGSTFLFQVALALLKLNERSLLKCDTPAGIYGYINHQMTNHAISIDGLINASEALKRVVKRADVEERRQRVVDAEKELMRERELARGPRPGPEQPDKVVLPLTTGISQSQTQIGNSLSSEPASPTDTRSKSLQTETVSAPSIPESEELRVQSPVPVDDA
ncbi:TBC-domain-containing protein [Xylona heveae TC161]|uniref:TBC-domain-containing protein n=1 Tax=Xylona heveae (strain CBS 132557 / TC161) TaxID=1328760 RepID=A0A164ZRV6_XYLHT|nr:TBC-domain-containing protein [Xylona heveae TC161]KZF19434.1 TBC-domain-containing protein [Xylona heveae TC161]